MRHKIVAIIVPCFRVKSKILAVLDGIGPEVDMVVVVDDACPEGSGEHVRAMCRDPRVEVVSLTANQGVGGAVLAGYFRAIGNGADILVKLDGDGQMDPALLPLFIEPIRRGHADYTKGNRFHNIEDLKAMPAARLVGNAILSFMTKASSGYWTIFDPTNGYTALSTAAFRQLAHRKIARRYFFESDMLFRLGTIRAKVVDVPMAAIYADETSGLKVRQILGPFLLGNLRNFGKRVFYNYFLRDFTIASLQLVLGLCLLAFGTIFGAHAWAESSSSGIVASTGTVMLAALPIIVGMQLLLSFQTYDMAATPDRAISPLLPDDRHAAGALRADRMELEQLVSGLDDRRKAA